MSIRHFTPNQYILPTRQTIEATVAPANNMSLSFGGATKVLFKWTTSANTFAGNSIVIANFNDFNVSCCTRNAILCFQPANETANDITFAAIKSTTVRNNFTGHIKNIGGDKAAGAEIWFYAYLI